MCKIILEQCWSLVWHWFQTLKHQNFLGNKLYFCHRPSSFLYKHQLHSYVCNKIVGISETQPQKMEANAGNSYKNLFQDQRLPFTKQGQLSCQKHVVYYIFWHSTNWQASLSHLLFSFKGFTITVDWVLKNNILSIFQLETKAKKHHRP